MEHTKLTPPPRIVLGGDACLFVEFEQRIDVEIHQRVLDLARKIDLSGWPEVIETVPAFSSLTVYFRLLQTTLSELTQKIRGLLSLPSVPAPRAPTLTRIPVAYGDEFGPDLEFVALHNGISPGDVIRLHTLKPLRVFMLGFAPGFPYLAEIPPEIRAPRLDEPRLKVCAGSVGVAGSQSGIYPLEMPGGWRIIGRTPLALFDPIRAGDFPFEPGDAIQFYEISKEEYFQTHANTHRS
jgi:KipI family sensor histidine kinase inhibitor